MKETKITVTQGDEPIEIAMLADSIVAISEGIKKLRNTRLKDDALYLLIQHACPVIKNGYGESKKISVKQIKVVFAGIESLRSTYLKTGAK